MIIVIIIDIYVKVKVVITVRSTCGCGEAFNIGRGVMEGGIFSSLFYLS